MALWVGGGEHGHGLVEVVLLGPRRGPEVDGGRRRVLEKVAAGGGEEGEIRRLEWSGGEGALGELLRVVRDTR